MKKLLFILTLILLSSCTHTIKESGIISCVEKANSENYIYVITIDNVDCFIGNGGIKVLTNTLYQVGDTVKLYKLK